MIALSIIIRKDELYYAVLKRENEETGCCIITYDKRKFDSTEDCRKLMRWFENEFQELIAKYKPNKIVYKTPYLTSINKSVQLAYYCYPIGILNLVCGKKDLELSERSTQWINSKSKIRIAECKTHFSLTNVKINAFKVECITMAWKSLE